MDAIKLTQQMVAFQKQSYDNFQSIWGLTQKQTSGTVDRLLDQASWIPKEGHQALENWRTHMKHERKRVTAYLDRNFAIYEKMLTSPQTVPAAKTNKPEKDQ